MIFARKLIHFSFISLLLTACFNTPNYPSKPEIEYAGLEFVDVGDPSLGDSLILSIDFRDGDGDLGLSSDDTDIIYQGDKALFFNDRFYFTKDNQRTIQYTQGGVLTYADKRQRPELNLPAYVKPYRCINWEIKKEGDRQDTIYFELNENHYNIFVDFYIKQNDGSFKLFDWRTEFCTTFNGRFPVLSKSLDTKNPLGGVIHYAMVSSGFKIQFSIQTLKLKITIQDRSQQRSNEIETPEFQFR